MKKTWYFCNNLNLHYLTKKQYEKKLKKVLFLHEFPLILPNGQRTDNYSLYVKEWKKNKSNFCICVDEYRRMSEYQKAQFLGINNVKANNIMLDGLYG